jgi:hypothetical protein
MNNIETNQTAVNGSALIAEFMGCQKSDYVDSIYVMNYMKDKPHYIPSLMEYNNSWDWLMPVVKKIQQLKIDDFSKKKPIMNALMDLEIKSLYDAVIVFLKWWTQFNR